jgi:hypothetical protein
MSAPAVGYSDQFCGARPGRLDHDLAVSGLELVSCFCAHYGSGGGSRMALELELLVSISFSEGEFVF